MNINRERPRIFGGALVPHNMKLSLPNVILNKWTTRASRFLERVRIDRIRAKRYAADEVPYPSPPDENPAPYATDPHP